MRKLLSKTLILFAVLVFLLAGGFPVLANVVEISHGDLEVSRVGMPPTNPFYFLKEWGRGIKMFFTFNPVAKAVLELEITNIKAAEALETTEKFPGDVLDLSLALDNYEDSISRLKERLTSLTQTSENSNVKKLIEKVDERLEKHQLLFDQLVQKHIGQPGYEEVEKKAEEIREKTTEAISKAGERGKDIKDKAAKAVDEAKATISKLEKAIALAGVMIKEPPVSQKTAGCNPDLMPACPEIEGMTVGWACIDDKWVCVYFSKSAEVRNFYARNNPKDRIVVNNKTLNYLFKVYQRAKNLLNQAQEHLAKAEQSFSDEKYGRAFGLATAAKVQATNGLRILEKDLKDQLAQGFSPRVDKPKIRDEKKSESVVCTQQYDPICAVNGKTYSNSCMAKAAGIEVKHKGECLLPKKEEPSLTEPSNIGSVMPVPESNAPETKVVHQFTLEADDLGFYPSSEISVPKGDNVELTFKVRNVNVYYGGLWIKSSKFDTGTLKPGGNKTVEFLADESFTFTSYWPISNVMKANGKVIVQ